VRSLRCLRIAAAIGAVSARAALASAAPPELLFERYDVERGLPHDTISAMAQSGDGFLWIATDDGVARFDGHTFRAYRIDPAAGASQRFWTVAESADGALWAGGAAGLFRYDRAAGRLVSEPLLAADGAPASGVVKIATDSSGRLWVAAQRAIFVRAPGERRLRELPVESGSNAVELARLPFASLAVAPDGTVWLQRGSGLREPLALYRLAGDRFELVARLAPETLHAGLFVDRRGALWLHGELGGLAEVGGRPRAALGGAAGRAALGGGFDPGGDTLWLATGDGLYLHQRTSGSSTRVALDAEESFHRRWVRAVLVDADGGVWAGTVGGLYHADPHRKPFRPVRPELPLAAARAPARSGAAIGGLVEDRSGALWVGTIGGGLDRLDLATGRVEHHRHDPRAPSSLCGDQVWHLFEASDGRIWASTSGGLCVGEPGGRFARVEPTGLSVPLGASAVAEAPPGVLWIASSSAGLVRFDLASRATRRFAHDSFRNYGTFLSLGERELWIGDSAGELVRIDPRAAAIERRSIRGARGAVSGPQIYDLAPAPGGRLWVATEAGLARYDPALRTVDHPLAGDPLPGSVVFSILAERSGRLWLGTNHGLVRVDFGRPPGERVRAFDRSDGVASLEMNRYSRLALRSGSFAFGGMNGLTLFDPAAIVDDPRSPRLALERVTIVGRDGERVLRPAAGELVEIGASDQAFTIEVASVGFTRPDRHRFAHRLEPLDADWADAGARRSARYTRVPPGEYRFTARVANQDGRWSAPRELVALRVVPPWWRTGWFRAAALIALAATSYGAHRLRVSRLVAEERLRLALASDLHDELGSELSGIALTSALVARSAALSPAERAQLERVRAVAERAQQGVRHIVWSLHPAHDTVGSLAARLRSAAEELLAGVEWSFEAEVGEASSRLGMEARRELLLVLRELLTNVARHARATRVEIALAREGEALVLRVADDGVGAPAPDLARGGTGLASLARRAERLGGEFALAPRPGGGTAARVAVPLARSRHGALAASLRTLARWRSRWRRASAGPGAGPR
jgi:signal transduction histidine kinase/ligand-binding sensor domain-containing protein